MNQVFERGQAVHFNHLHNNRPCRIISGPDECGDYLFEIEGKARPMLVLGQRPLVRVGTATNTERPSGRNECTFYEAKGRLGYLVVPVQHQKPPGGWLKYVSLLGDDEDSYVVLQCLCYPAESVAWKNQSPIRVGGRRLLEIEKQLTAVNLGYRDNCWDRA
jgi:hypothetical protein